VKQIVLVSSERVEEMVFKLRSKAFTDGGFIPMRYTCDGDNLSPPLEWTEPPRRTASLVLICDDLDAPGATQTHWLMYNIPPDYCVFPQGMHKTEVLPWGCAQGCNDFGEIGYGGPCLNDGQSHRYIFRLFAVDATPSIPPGLSRMEVFQRIRAHILADTSLVGCYQRTC
jgi:Raf kinase inhibitor-like YbhB/YbcL family protein